MSETDKSMADMLLEARDRVASGWCKGARAKTADGNPNPDGPDQFLDSLDPRAAQWCMIGAAEAAQGRMYGPIWNFINNHLKGHGYSGGYLEFNDGSDRTQNQVIGMLDDMARHAKDLGV